MKHVLLSTLLARDLAATERPYCRKTGEHWTGSPNKSIDKIGNKFGERV